MTINAYTYTSELTIPVSFTKESDNIHHDATGPQSIIIPIKDATGPHRWNTKTANFWKGDGKLKQNLVYQSEKKIKLELETQKYALLRIQVTKRSNYILDYNKNQ